MISSKIITIFLVVIVMSMSWWVFFGNSDTIDLRFDNYIDIPENNGVNTWLPPFFPKTAKNIDFHSNMDINFFYVTFELGGHQSELFQARFSEKTSLNGYEYINKISEIDKSWCSSESQDDEKSSTLYLIGKLKNNGGYIITGIFDIKTEGHLLYCKK